VSQSEVGVDRYVIIGNIIESYDGENKIHAENLLYDTGHRFRKVAYPRYVVLSRTFQTHFNMPLEATIEVYKIRVIANNKMANAQFYELGAILVMLSKRIGY
jgi:hypothetical protein